MKVKFTGVAYFEIKLREFEGTPLSKRILDDIKANPAKYINSASEFNIINVEEEKDQTPNADH